MSIKIGILLPRSDMFPTLALDFLNGFRLGLSARGNDIKEPKLFIESIGNATGDSVIKTAERMILQENVDLTVSFCSIFNLKELVNSFTSYRKNLIHVDLGGNVITQDHISPYVTHLSLNLWQSACRSGEYAAAEFGKNAVVAASFYDGGYHLLENFVQGFTSSGGNIVYPFIASFDYKSESYQNLVDGIEKFNPDFVFSLFSYKEEEKVLGVLSKNLSNKNLRFIWSPLINTKGNGTEKYQLTNLHTLASWDFESRKPEMQNFMNSYVNTYELAPNVISLLGFETSLIVSQSIAGSGKLENELGAFSGHLKIKSPRGQLTFNSFHESQILNYTLKKYDFSSHPHTQLISQSIRVDGEDKLYDKYKDIPLTGWQNPYIIT